MARSLAFVLAALAVQSTSGIRLGGSAEEKCIVPEPELQLRKKYYVALFSNTTNDADYEMLKEGVQDHPMLELVSDLGSADYVFANIQGDSFSDALPPPSVPREKIILIDWSDGPMVPPYMYHGAETPRWSAVFKRSYVHKIDGVLTDIDGTVKCETCYPLSYGVMNQYIEHLNEDTIGGHKKRPVSLMCSLRPDFHDSEVIIRDYWMARNRVVSWLHNDKDLPKDAVMHGKNGGLTGEGFTSGVTSLIEKGMAEKAEEGKKFHEKKGEFSFEQLGNLERSSIGPEYGKLLEQSRIAVTAGPASYEGDHRMWEHFAKGNALLSDQLYIPIPFAPKAGKHYIQYDIADKPGNKEAFLKKVHEAIDNPDKMKKMACAGMQLAMRHHRSVSRVDYIIRTMAAQDEFEQYAETGKDLKQRDPVQTPSQRKYTSLAHTRNPTYLRKLD